MSKYKPKAWGNTEIDLNNVEEGIYLLFSNYVKNLTRLQPNVFLLDIAYKFLESHLNVIKEDGLSEDAKKSMKIHLKNVSRNI